MPPLPESEDLMSQWEAAEQAVAEREASGVQPKPHSEKVSGRDASGKFAKEPEVASGEAEASEAPEGPQADVAGSAAATRPDKAPAKGSVSGGEPTELTQLHELAKKHGLIIEDAKVLPRERHAFREERRQARAALEREKAAFAQERDTTLAQVRAQGAAVLNASRLFEAGDFDGFAQALGAKDWNEINSRVINQFADPNYKKLQELERRERAREEQTHRQREEQTRQAAAQQEARAQAEYKSALGAQMAEAEDPFIKAMSDDPNFVNAVFRIQEAHFDGHETISFEEAVRLKPKQGGSPLLEQMRTLYFKLKRSGAFEGQDDDGDRPAAKQVETGNRDAQRPAKSSRNTTISQKDASAASRPVNFSDDKEFMAYAHEQMAQAAREDEQARRKRKAG